MLAGLVASLGACGTIGGWFGGGTPAKPVDKTTKAQLAANADRLDYGPRSTGTSIFNLFTNRADPNVTVGVNKYLWRASLDVLNFLPIQSTDPFTGVIVTGFGTPPGGGRAYRATIYVGDPALDARSLKVALVSKGGPVDAATARAVEDAILTRARQLRIQDGNL
ncbi:MAG: DUF3576 domain-containing protein [Proteobacteria bacterium]|nr:DUF3576 domain-containing protein [Pseudomonadota bacterium]MBS0572178.1 DUF3576 domain-containing protein [Pseudomonadota bacterium]